MFLIARAVFSLIQFHALGDVNPLVSVFTLQYHYESIVPNSPFRCLGFRPAPPFSDGVPAREISGWKT